MTVRRRYAVGTVAAVLLGALLSLLGPTAYAATATDPTRCQSPKVPVAAVQSCPTEAPAPTPSSSGSPTAPPTANSKTPQQTDEQKNSSGQGVQFGQDEEPTGWAGPIAKDLGQGVQGLAKDLTDKIKAKGLLPQFEFSQGYLSLYAVMFGLGVLIAVMATMLASVKVAAAKGVDSRIMAQQALIRVLAFSAVGGLAPLLLAVLGDAANALAGGFYDLAADQLVSNLAWLAGALSVGTLASLIIPGGSAVMTGMFLFLLLSLGGIFLELMVSHFLIFLLGLLIPVLFAASINPDWRGGVKKVSGALLGAFLAPAALFLVWVVTFAAVPPWSADTSFFTRAGTLVVGLLMSLAAPLAVGMLLSYIVPAFAGGHGYDTNAFTAAANRVQRRDRGQQSPGPRSSRAKRASDATDQGPAPAPESSTAAPGAAQSGGGSAAGPVAAAAGLWMKLVGKARRTAETTRDNVGTSASRYDAGDADPGSTSPSEPSGPDSAGGRGPGTGGRGREQRDGDRPHQGPDRPAETGARPPGPAGARSRGSEHEPGGGFR